MSSWKQRIRTLAVQALVTAVLLEAVLRVANPLEFRLRGDRIVLPVRARYTITNFNHPKLDPVAVHTRNSLGFRGPERPADFASRLSIVTVGGSTTECFLLADGKTWPDVMAAALSPARPDLWVNNAGLDGHSTFGHLVLLRSVLADLRPTMVLYLAGINDVGRTFPDEREGAPGQRPPTRWRNWAGHSEVANTLLKLVRIWRARHLNYANAVDRPYDVVSHPRLVMTDDELDAFAAPHRPLAEAYQARLAVIARESRHAGIEPAFLTQPLLAGDAIDPATGADLATLVDLPGRNGLADWRVLEMYNDAMRAVAAAEGILLIDLARQLPKDSRLFLDFVHFSNDGARAVGQIVAAELGRHLVR